MKRRSWVIWSISILITLCFLGLLWIKAQKDKEVPTIELANARLSIFNAKVSGADIHGIQEYTLAVARYDSALSGWGYENDRIFIFRNFDKVRRFAMEADSMANLALRLTEGLVDDAQSIVLHRAELIKEKLELLKVVNTKFKTPDDINTSIRNLQSEFATFNLIRENEKWVEGELFSAELLNQSEVLLSQCQEYLTNYFLNFEDWKAWGKEAIEQSRKKRSYTIIVDKIAEQFQLFYAGRQINVFTAEFGQNWIGDKQFEGDKTTPEGNYRILKKKHGKETKYYKALIINYPNENDKMRFLAHKKKGILDAAKKIGGLIEIHGDGGKGYHWTDGCIALKNSDMDNVYKLVPVNTPVVIVGSLRPLEELIEL